MRKYFFQDLTKNKSFELENKIKLKLQLEEAGARMKTISQHEIIKSLLFLFCIHHLKQLEFEEMNIVVHFDFFLL